MNTLDYLIKQDDQISQSMPECENVNRVTERMLLSVLNYHDQFLI